LASITLIENFRAVFYAPFYAALALGAYAEEGLEVRLLSSPDPARTPEALLEGRGDVTWGGPMRVMVACDRDPGCGLVIFCEVVGRDPFFLLGREPNPRFRFEDLRGRRLATVSEVPTPWMCLQHDMRLAGVDPAAVERTAGRSMAENAAALRAGEADVVQVFQPLAEELVEEGAGHIWYAAADRGPTTYTAFYTRREIWERDPESLLRMTRAMYRTQRWLGARGGEEIAGRVASYFPGLPRATLARALSRYQSLGLWNRTPLLPRESFEWLRAACRSGGLIREGAPYERCVEMRLAERAVADDPPPM